MLYGVKCLNCDVEMEPNYDESYDSGGSIPFTDSHDIYECPKCKAKVDVNWDVSV